MDAHKAHIETAEKQLNHESQFKKPSKVEDEVRKQANHARRRSWKRRSTREQPCRGFKAESSQF